MYLDYSVSSGPFLSNEIEIGDGPGPELDKYTSPNPSLLYMGWGFINIYLDFFLLIFPLGKTSEQILSTRLFLPEVKNFVVLKSLVITFCCKLKFRSLFLKNGKKGVLKSEVWCRKCMVAREIPG